MSKRPEFSGEDDAYECRLNGYYSMTCLPPGEMRTVAARNTARTLEELKEELRKRCKDPLPPVTAPTPYKPYKPTFSGPPTPTGYTFDPAAWVWPPSEVPTEPSIKAAAPHKKLECHRCGPGDFEFAEPNMEINGIKVFMCHSCRQNPWR